MYTHKFTPLSAHRSAHAADDLIFLAVEGQAVINLFFGDDDKLHQVQGVGAFTQHTAMRTAKLDILETIRWSAVDNLKQTAPQLKWSRRLTTLGQFLAMRVDQMPFTDIRVRRALNMAVNKPEIVSAYYGGHAELFGYPMHPDYHGYYEPWTRCRPR